VPSSSTMSVSPFGGPLFLNRPSRVDNRVFSFLKVKDLGALTASAAGDVTAAFSFTLSDLSESSSYTSIYDQWRLDRLDIHVLGVTQPGVTASVTPAYAFLSIVTDYDDTAALAAFSLSLNYENVAVIGPGQGHQRTIVPRMALAAGGTTQFANSRQWIDCSSTSTPWYGIKTCIKQSTSTNVPSWYLFARYHISFRNVR
jgi:hypothetical protein